MGEPAGGIGLAATVLVREWRLMMLMAHPAVLKNLVEQYETLHALHATQGSESARQRMEDVAYTLCVSTNTRDVETALLTARRQLSDTRLSLGNAVPAA